MFRSDSFDDLERWPKGKARMGEENEAHHEAAEHSNHRFIAAIAEGIEESTKYQDSCEQSC